MDWLSIKEFLLDTIKYVVTLVVIFIIILYVVSIAQVVGNSMYPTLNNNEVLILNKLKYRFQDIEREDIISLTHDEKHLIKRVIGLPGEKIDIVDNKLYINEEEYSEDYLKENLNYKDFHITDIGYDHIPDDMYLVLGDNRENSLDSRKIGLIKKSEINGKISFRFWPLNKFKLF